ncbi:hypothetical protein AB0D51_35795, partial [Streptomyces sp. NPDC048312]
MEPRTGKRADSGRPRPSLSPRRIVEACLALMDAEGADALTFRRVGAQLGCARRPLSARAAPLTARATDRA